MFCTSMSAYECLPLENKAPLDATCALPIRRQWGGGLTGDVQYG